MLAAAGVAGVVVYYGLFFRGQLPDHRWITGYNDLVLHAAAVPALSVPLLLWPLRIVAPALILLAAVIELVQFWIPRRNPGWDDVAASLAGIPTGALCMPRTAGLRGRG